MAKRGGGYAGGMPGSMNNLMKQAQRMQRQMEEAQKELEAMTFDATSGGGVVCVEVSGKKEVTAIEIKPEVVDPDDIEMLQDLVMTAVNEALKKVDDYSQQKMGGFSQGLSIPGLM